MIINNVFKLKLMCWWLDLEEVNGKIYTKGMVRDARRKNLIDELSKELKRVEK